MCVVNKMVTMRYFDVRHTQRKQNKTECVRKKFFTTTTTIIIIIIIIIITIIIYNNNNNNNRKFLAEHNKKCLFSETGTVLGTGCTAVK